MRLGAGEKLRLINTHGTQVVDTWAFNADDMAECMSMEHSRVAIGGVFPRPGDTMVTNKRRPILTLVEDTSPGIHDTLIAACDRWRYILLGAGDLLVGRLLHYDALSARFTEFKQARNPECRYCADGAEFPGYIDYQEFCALAG